MSTRPKFVYSARFLNPADLSDASTALSSTGGGCVAAPLDAPTIMAAASSSKTTGTLLATD